ncbi:FAD:protein FMN transferase [Kiloniella antarctica]|uniref:FAD:protein FMN transferase n=1 Tax=Kiloniella antarctica TaxID=1550907 RepID=A0ABW5BNF7_9PROT
MSQSFNRRRFLQITTTAALLSATGGYQASASNPLYRWRGVALGGQAEILLPAGLDVELIGNDVVSELKRLERIFSLYDTASEVSQLNREGILNNPSPEFVELLQKSKQVSELTNGNFDVTVQPLWELHSAGSGYSKVQLLKLEQSIRGLLGYKNLKVSSEKISFKKGGMAITLNGIAQGYITDKITQLLSNHGLTDSLINIGEIKALGHHPDGRNWKVAIADTSSNKDPLQTQQKSVSLNDGQAIATSSYLGTTITDGTPHLLNPLTHQDEYRYQSMSVIASDATTADALSTGFSFMSIENIRNIVDIQPNLKVHAVDNMRRTYSV